ncbi:MAG: flagellar hook-length control protein FliK [Lachnospiraceae bacterium]|nr:flagellar hook-length control protein FliK [Lachnospiraceae bacterium]
MNFDLTGLFQRQSQIPVADQSVASGQGMTGAQNVSGTQFAAGQGSNLNLSVGQIISGQVVAVDGDIVQVELSPGTILQAKVEDGLSLLKGMSVSFEVSGMSDKQVALRALFQNTAHTATMNKALEAAQLPVTAETTTMVNAMMKEGMPIDKESLQTMYRQVSAHPEVGSADIVTMNRLEIPITDGNVRQFSDYMNMEHQIRGSVETIADSMTDTIAQLVSEGKTAEAAQLMKQFTDIFVRGSETPQSPADDIMPGQEKALQAVGKDMAHISDAVPGGDGKIIVQDSVATDRTMTMSLEELMRAVTETSEDGRTDSVMGQAADAQTKMQALLSEMENLGLPAEKSEQFLRGQLLGNELLDFTNELLSKLSEKGSGMSQTQLGMFAEFLQKPELQNAIRGQFFEQWLMTPEDVADKQKVSEFYQKLANQAGKLSEALKSIPGADQNLMNQVTNVQQNIDFMNQLNQTMSYVQFPLKLAGDNAHGDLYVYTNKKNLAQNDGNVSAFLHLDMDHLGPVDVYVAMQNQKVSTQFYLKDDEMLAFIHENIGILNERLEQKGYQMNAQFSVKEKGGNVMQEIVEDHRENVRISTNSFDMRA